MTFTLRIKIQAKLVLLAQEKTQLIFNKQRELMKNIMWDYSSQIVTSFVCKNTNKQNLYWA